MELNIPATQENTVPAKKSKKIAKVKKLDSETVQFFANFKDRANKNQLGEKSWIPTS